MQSIQAFWAMSLSCPVCNQRELEVIREAGVPDVLHCKVCGTEFELSQRGDLIRLMQYPKDLGIDLYGVWMPYGEVCQKMASTLNGKRPTLPVMIAVTGQHKSMTRTESGKDNQQETKGSEEPPERAVQQAMKLLELGNSREEVRQILEKDPRLTPHQIERIMEIVEEPRRTRLLERFLLLVLVVLGLIVVGLLIYPSGIFNRAFAIVNGLVSGETALLSPPPTVTQYARQGRSFTCPPTPQGAAALFGGKVNHWHFDGKNWIYTDIQGISVYVPEGLSARYIYFNPVVEIKTIEGPALINPIMAVSIDCYR